MMKRAFRASIAAIVLIGVSFAAAAAWDQTAEDRESARRLFEEGKTRRDAGDAAGALESFRASNALMNVPTTKLAVARAYLTLGRLIEARTTALLVAQIPWATGEPQPFSDARASAARLAVELEARIPRLTITFQGEPAQTLILDGTIIPPDSWSAPRPVGKHVIVGRLGDREAREEIVLAEHDNKTIVLDLGPRRTEAPRPARVASLRSAAPIPFGTLFWAGAGLGAVGVGVGAVSGLVSMSNKSDADALCRSGKCPPPAHSALDAANRWATVSTIGFVAAGVGAAMAGISLAIRPSSTRQGSTVIFLHGGVAGVAGKF